MISFYFFDKSNRKLIAFGFNINNKIFKLNSTKSHETTINGNDCATHKF